MKFLKFAIILIFALFLAINTKAFAQELTINCGRITGLGVFSDGESAIKDAALHQDFTIVVEKDLVYNTSHPEATYVLFGFTQEKALWLDYNTSSERILVYSYNFKQGILTASWLATDIKNSPSQPKDAQVAGYVFIGTSCIHSNKSQ